MDVAKRGQGDMYQHGESANDTLGGVMKRLQLVCLLGFLTVACRDVADPTLRRSPLSPVIDAAAGDLGVTLTYNGAAPPASGAVGQLVAHIIATDALSTSSQQTLGPVTDHDVFTDIVPGSYTLFISGVLLQVEVTEPLPVGGGVGGQLVVLDPLQDAVTIAAGGKTTHSFELAPAVGIVKGTATINGQHPAAGSKICVNAVQVLGNFLQDRSCAELAPPPALCTTTSEGLPPGCGPAAFALFAAPAGRLPNGRQLANTLTLISATGLTLATKSVTILPGQTTDVGSYDAGTGDLDVTLTYNGAAPPASGAVGQLVAHIITTDALSTSSQQTLGPVTDHDVFTDIVPGSYTLFISGVLLQVEVTEPLPVGGGVGGQLDVLDPLQDAVTIAAGGKTTHSFELAPAVGIVKGTATINGQLANTLTLISATGLTLATKSVTILPGQTTDVGSYDAGTGDLDVTLTYNGAAPPASGAVGQLVAHIITTDALSTSSQQTLGPVTDHDVFTDIVPGSYTLF